MNIKKTKLVINLFIIFFIFLSFDIGSVYAASVQKLQQQTEACWYPDPDPRSTNTDNHCKWPELPNNFVDTPVYLPLGWSPDFTSADYSCPSGTTFQAVSLTRSNSNEGDCCKITGSFPNRGLTTQPAQAIATLTYNCVSGAVNGSCSFPRQQHYDCSAGTSANNVDGASAWTWSCNGSGGGTNASCTEPKSYQTPIVYQTPSGPPVYRVEGKVFIDKNGDGVFNSGLGDIGVPEDDKVFVEYWYPGWWIIIPAGWRPFINPPYSADGYYYTNERGDYRALYEVPGIQYRVSHITATGYTPSTLESKEFKVPPDFTWNFGMKPNTPAMSSTLTGPPSCVIASGASSCNVTLSWSIINPEAIPTNITAVGMANINVTSSLATPQSGTQSVFVPYNSRTFYLYNNAKPLAEKNVSSSCTPGTIWLGGICAVPVTSISVSLFANPTSMTLPINTTRLTWTTAGSPTSCVASEGWSGAKTASGGFQDIPGLTVGTRTYTITCSKIGTPNAVSWVTVTVNPVSSFSVTVIKKIGGFVKSTDNFINCGSTCVRNYDRGTIVTLKAYPESSYWKFSGWSGDCSGTGFCVLNVTSPKTAIPSFQLRLFDYREF